MSNTLHNVVNASFFPTVNELTSGVKWFKDHPFLTAVAATAVSAITYWSTINSDSDLEFDESEQNQKQEFCATKAHHRTTEESKNAEKTLPACVSWCDEHGSSLTQVFEDIAPSNDSESEEEAQVIWKGAQHGASADSRRPEANSGDNTSDRWAHSDNMLEDGLLSGAACRSDVDFEIQSESPQWGWYVAITPPEDNTLPREVSFGMPKKFTNMTSSERTSPSPILKRTFSGKLG
ncbi:hypothetical protein ABG067_003453 [Albugo candida]